MAQSSALVGPGGEVIGVDYDDAMIAEADRRAVEANVKGWVRHLCVDVDAGALPFEPNYFDACRSERVFQHLHDPRSVLREMIRVTRPGGWIVVFDADWATYSIATPEVDIERRLTRFFAEHFVQNGYVGRDLYRLFKEQGLTGMALETNIIPFTNYLLMRQIFLLDEVESKAVACGILTPEELRRWHLSLEQAETMSASFASVGGVLIAARKPL